MIITLDKIAKSIFEQTSKISEPEEAKLSEIIACGNTLIELMGYLLNQSSLEKNSIFKNVLDEIFVDLHVSTTLSMGSQYKSACVLLRTCLETSLYVLYFLDHPVEAHMWANEPETSNIMDMSFYKTSEKLTSCQYAKAASHRPPDIHKLEDVKSTLHNNYRLLSQRVHGKYVFLQSTTTNSKQLLDDFSNLALESVKSLITLGTILSKEPHEQIIKNIPALEKYL